MVGQQSLGEMQAALDEAQELERDAEAFFTPKNFEAMRMLPAGSQAEALSDFRWNFRLQCPPTVKLGHR